MSGHKPSGFPDLCFTIDDLKDAGMGGWVEKCERELACPRQNPSALIRTEFGQRVYASFSETLLKVFVEDLPRIEKAFDVTLRCGFRGFSKGGKNGVFYQRPQDKRLSRRTDKALALQKEKSGS